jgi:hypothetical protein
MVFFKKKNVLQITTSAISLKRRELPEKSWEKKKQPTTMATKAKKSQRLFLGGFLAEQRVMTVVIRSIFIRLSLHSNRLMFD